ncbi:hypothetical protein [Brevibacillus reuszeri]|uniref:hypothetical protein n=1 Tax=Brevibacillus reuszeri TaxID=54915 RepID=UPI000CCC2D04|nr:hypothetical protein [Brevibacillus reuszeri]
MSTNTALKPKDVTLPHYTELIEEETNKSLDFLRSVEKRAAEIHARVQMTAAKYQVASTGRKDK